MQLRSGNRYFLQNRRNPEDDELMRALEASKKSFAEEERKRKELERKQRELELHYARLREQLELERQTSQQSEKSETKWPWDEETLMKILLENMKWSTKHRKYGVGIGLKNLGNSCFMNATIQCLAYTPVLAQLLCEGYHTPICTKSKKEFCALREMETLVPLLLLQKKKNQFIRPVKFFRNIPAVNELLSAGCQEDAHEYLQGLLDRLEVAYDKNQNKKKTTTNPLKRVMEGGIKTDVMCGGCRTRNIVEEPFYCLSLDSSKGDSIEECLTVLSHDELMEGENRYFCNKCDRKRLARKKMAISKLPAVLMLHLKRFSFDADYKMTKISKHIEFPLVLDFGEKSPYIHEDDHTRIENGDRIYELYAVLVHSGPQLGYGHYYAIVKAPDGKWYRMNDSEVLPTTPRRVLKEQAYILFYRRTTHSEYTTKLQQLNPSFNVVNSPDKTSPNNTSSFVSEESSDEKIPHSNLNVDYFQGANCARPASGSLSPNETSEQHVTPTNRPKRDVPGVRNSSPFVKIPDMDSVPEMILNYADTADGNGEYSYVFGPESEIYQG